MSGRRSVRAVRRANSACVVSHAVVISRHVSPQGDSRAFYVRAIEHELTWPDSSYRAAASERCPRATHGSDAVPNTLSVMSRRSAADPGWLKAGGAWRSEEET